MLGIVNIVIPSTSPATNLAKTVANTSYSLLEYLHGMQGVSGSNPLGSIEQQLVIMQEDDDFHLCGDYDQVVQEE